MNPLKKLSFGLSIFYFLCISSSLFAQAVFNKQNIDQKNDTAWNIAESNTKRAYEIAFNCNQLSNDNNYIKGEVESNMTLGLISLLNGDFELALTKTLSALNKVENDSTKAVIENQIGRIYLELNVYDNAKNALNEAIKINSRLNTSYLTGNYINYGNLKEKNFEIDSAFYYYDKAYNIAIKYSDTMGIVTSLNNKGTLSGILNNLELERSLYTEAYKIAPKESNQKSQLATNIAISYFSDNNYENAKKYIDIAYNLAKNNDFLKGQQQARLFQSKIEEKKGNYPKSLEYLKDYQKLTSNLLDDQTLKKITQIQLSNDFKQSLKLDSLEKQQEIETIEAENKKQGLLRQEEIEKRNVIIYFIIAFLLGAVYVAYRFFKVGIERKEANKIISDQKIEVEKQRDISKQEQAIAQEQKLIVELKNREILESIHYAKRLQSAILPPLKQVAELLPDSFIFYKPKDIVAGDFYWVEKANRLINNEEKSYVFFAVADCTGHGVPGAMVSVVCANALNRSLKEFKLTDPGEILDKVTDLVLEAFEKGEEIIKDGMDIALCCLEKTTGKLLYSGANISLMILSEHNQINTESKHKSICLENDQKCLHEIKAVKQPVGRFENHKKFITNSILLNLGDEIILTSDGFADQFGGKKGKKYMSLNFKKFLLTIKNEPLSNQNKLIASEFENWLSNYEQVDDVCVMGIKHS